MQADPLGVWAYRPEQPRQDQTTGPLADLTFSAKDLYGVRGWPLRGGTNAPLAPTVESPLVLRLLQAGATLVGTTQLHEVALGVTGHNAFGGTRNPLDPARVAGGSSGGAAASVAQGDVDFALGTDTGGSIRIPASLCGVVGFKPSFGLYSTEGVFPLSPTCDHAGPIAKDMRTITRVHEVVTGQPPLESAWIPRRAAVWNVRDWVTPDVWQVTQEYAARLRQLGVDVSSFDFPDVMSDYTPIVLSEAAQIHREALALSETGFTPRTLGLLRQGAALSAADVARARARREELRGTLEQLFETFDVLIAPAVPDVAPLVDQEDLTLPGGVTPVRQALLRLTAPWSFLGVPTLALPVAHGGLSVGVQLITRWESDAQLLALGRTLENA